MKHHKKYVVTVDNGGYLEYIIIKIIGNIKIRQ